MKSKRFEVLAARPVNQDGYVQEWPEVGLIAMNSPFDPKPSIKIENGVITEMDGKCRADFDMLDTFIADHAIRLGNAEKAMAMDATERTITTARTIENSFFISVRPFQKVYCAGCLCTIQYYFIFVIKSTRIFHIIVILLT